MLVLSRKKGEGIWFKMQSEDGKEIKFRLRVIEMRNGQKVRLGIEAPENVTILRDELVDANGDNYEPEVAEV